MVSKDDGWIRIFDIPETSRHTGGFTIYKTISMVYPKNSPDSVTKITVWKRYNDFRKLYSSIKALSKSLKIKDKYPALPGPSYFNRFNEHVIQERRINILRFLDYLGSHPQLFLSDKCVTFFKTSYTPTDLVSGTGNIHSIRAELHLPVESDYDLIPPNSDEDHTVSDSDSISTLSSAIEHLPDPINLSTSTHVSTTTTRRVNSLNSRASSHDSLNTSFSTTNISLDGLRIAETPEDQVFPTPPHTPKSSTNYILDASHYITQAVDYEIAKNYEDAFSSYKTGIDILLKNVKDDTDFEHKEMVRRKVEKYLLRAERIYNIHLSPDSKAIQGYSMGNEEQEETLVHQAVSDLYKYKVIKVIGSGMLALHSDTQQLYYIKVIHKTSKFSTDKLVLPGSMPYMVKLHNYYDCENALFLILQYCSGINTSDYMKRRTNADSVFTSSYNSESTPCSSNLNLQKSEESDSNSEHSYSNLIHDYALSRGATNELPEVADTDNASYKFVDVYDSKFEEVTKMESSTSADRISDCVLPKNRLDFDKTRRKASGNSSEISEWSSFDDEITEDALLPLEDVTKWAAQLLLALERLHLLGVICCDLQNKNILINESGDVALTYMCNVTEKYDLAFSENEDLILAPEMYGFNPITEAVDWWSYGAILYEWLVGMPLKSAHPKGISTSWYLKIPKYVTVEARSLLKQLLVYDAQERLGCGINGADDIKSHPFFNSVIWEHLASK